MKFINSILFFIIFIGFNHISKAQKTTIYTHQNIEYKSARELFDKEKYSAAQEKFRLIYSSTADKKSEVAVNAKFYIALCGLNLFNNDAENLFIEFIQDYPDSPKKKLAYFHLGNFHFRGKKYDEAIAWYSKLDPLDLSAEDLIEYKFKTGYSYFCVEQFDKASTFFYEIKDSDNKYTSPARYYYGHIAYLQKKYESALQTFLLLNNDEKFSPLTPYYIAQIYYLQNKYDKVIEYAPALLDTAMPARSSEIARIIGESYYRTKQYNLAIPYLKRFNNEKPTLATRSDYYQLGFAYYKTDSCNLAEDWFKKSIGEPDSISQTAHYHLAECYVKLNKKNYARNSFREAYKQPFDTQIKEDALFNYAKISYELSIHPFNDAIIAFEEFINTYPNSTKLNDAYEYLVAVYFTTKNYEAALKSLENIKTLDPKLQVAYQKVAHYRGLELFNNQKYQEAIAHFDKSDKYPYEKEVTAENTYWRAEAYYRMDDFVKSVHEYKKFIYEPEVISKNKNNANYNLGYAYFNLKEYENAKDWFRKYTQNAPTEQSKVMNDVLNRIGDCFFIQKQYKGAIEFYDKASMMGVYQSDYSLYQSSVCNGVIGNYSDKINLLQTLVSRKEKSHLLDDAFYELGETYLIQNQNEKALTAFRQLEKDHQNSPYLSKSMVKQGLIFFNQNQDNDALTIFKNVIAKYPGSEESKQALDKIKKIYIDNSDLATYETYLSSIGSPSESASLLDEDYYEVAENSYMNGNCNKAVADFTKYLEKFPNGNYVVNSNFYKAVCEQKSGFKNEALIGYNKVLESPKNKFTEQALLNAAILNQELGNAAAALNNYNQLEYIADVQNNVFLAQIEQMRLNFQMNNFDNAIKYCEFVINKSDDNITLTTEAHLIYGKCLLTKDDYNLALKNFKTASLNSNKYGAEAKYHVAQILYLRGEYDNCETEVFGLIKKFGSYDYWTGKSLILLSDNYIAKEDLFQAKVTLNTVIDKSKHSDLVANAKEKLRIIEENEASKKVEQKEEEININFGSELDIQKLFSEPEKPIEESIPSPQQQELKENE
ncbi:MAG: tetratricopeptide repeat protein [Flavobacteriales bacterium]|nr:tetratricopeptide repeat protein [Flavobacteriales bacterium]